MKQIHVLAIGAGRQTVRISTARECVSAEALHRNPNHKSPVRTHRLPIPTAELADGGRHYNEYGLEDAHCRRYRTWAQPVIGSLLLLRSSVRRPLTALSASTTFHVKHEPDALSRAL